MACRGRESGSLISEHSLATQFNNSGRPRSRPASMSGRGEGPAEDERPFSEIRRNVYDALRLVSLHRWAFFVPFSVVSCAAFTLSLSYPRTYRATTSFERKNDPVMMNLPMSSGAASFKYFRNTMVRDLTSVGNLEEVVDNLGLTEDYERNDQGELTSSSRSRRLSLARSLGGTLKINTASPSEHIDIITVTYTGPDPAIGRRLVDEVKRTYIRRTMAWIHNFLTSQRDYFQNEAKEADAKMKKLKHEDTRLRLENPLLDPMNPASIALSLSQLEMEHRELDMREREYSAELASMEQSLVLLVGPQAVYKPDDTLPQTHVRPLFMSAKSIELRDAIHNLDLKVKSLKAKKGMTDLHPSITALRRERDVLEQQLRMQHHQDLQLAPTETQETSIALGTPVLESPTLSVERNRVITQVAAQKAKLKDLRISITGNEARTSQLEQAKRDVYQKQDEFADVTGKVAQARQAQRQLQTTLASIEPAIKAIEQNRLLQFSEGLPARGSAIPVSPSAKTVILLALLAGLATGVVFVILAEVFDHVYRSSSQIARSLGLPLLESIDEIVTAQNRRVLFLRRVVLNPLIIGSFLLLLGTTGSMAYLSIERPWTYQKLRAFPDAIIRLFAESADSPNTPSATPNVS